MSIQEDDTIMWEAGLLKITDFKKKPPEKLKEVDEEHVEDATSAIQIHSVVFKNLQTAYKNNISKLSKNYLLMKTKRKEFSPNYYCHNRKQVRQYCVDDCRLTKELSQHWIDLFGKAFEFYPARWISSGYLAEKVLINHGIDVPFFRDLPYDLQEFAFNSYFGGRFEIIKRGFRYLFGDKNGHI